MNALSRAESLPATDLSSGADAPMFAPDRRSTPRSVTAWELLVWTYRDQKAHRFLKRVEHWLHFAIAISDLANDDTPRAKVDVDAALVHGAVMGLPQQRAAMIIDYAARDEQPDRSDTRPEPFPAQVDRNMDYWRRGVYRGAEIDYKIVVVERVSERVAVYRRNAKTHRRELVGIQDQVTEVEACPIDWFPDPSWAVAVNGIAEEWQAALAVLEPTLRALTLKRHVLVD